MTLAMRRPQVWWRRLVVLLIVVVVGTTGCAAPAADPTAGPTSAGPLIQFTATTL